MAHHDHQLSAKALCCEFDTAYLRGGHDIAGDADDKKVTHALIEDGFGGRARVGAAQDDREWALLNRGIWAPPQAGERFEALHVGSEAGITFTQAGEGVRGRDNR
jgi:hypothetical protein